MDKNKPNLMNDITEHAREVDAALDLESARSIMINVLERFRFKQKNHIFLQAIKDATSHERLQKMAWSLVLRGEELQVI